jgi:thymidylate synthase ThyX
MAVRTGEAKRARNPAMTTHDLDAREREMVAPYVTDPSGPVFALTGLPEVVKGALFARYSRSPKSLRRLLLDEFLPGAEGAPRAAPRVGEARAEALYDRVLAEYGDDSVAQLGGAHLAVEGASNLLTKVLQWGRLASYLEQSTRYIPYTDRPGGAYRYHRPAGVAGHPELGPAYERTLDGAFDAYAALLPRLVEHVGREVPEEPGTPPAARERAVRARALDLLRGLLPAATTANVGIFASGQAYEAMLVRMAAHPLPEARECAARMLTELRKVIPAFLTRVDRDDRGVAHGRYLAASDAAAARLAAELLPAPPPGPAGPGVTLVDFDPDGEARVLAHALWPAGAGGLAEARARASELGPAERARALAAWAGRRGDRRQRPGRALEATTYAFEVVCDYGAYRDLQRHRMLTLQAQPLTPRLGYDVPAEVEEAGLAGAYDAAQAACAALHDALAEAVPHAASYAVTLAHRIRFTMVLNAREAMHLIELRSQPQGHESYRRVAREMHRQIAEVAGHEAIAAMMSHVDASDPAAGRLAAERRQEARRASR